MRKSLWKLSAALALPIMAFTASSQAAIVYSSGGFETPTFVPGTIQGQDGWSILPNGSPTANTVTAVVGATSGKGGSAGLTYTQNTGANFGTANATSFVDQTQYYPTTGSDTAVDVFFQMKTNSGFGNASSLVGVALFGYTQAMIDDPSPVNPLQIGGAYFGKQGGQSYVYGYNPPSFATYVGNTQAQTTASSDGFLSYKIAFDFIAQTYSIYVSPDADSANYVLEVANVPFFLPGAVAIGNIDLTFINGLGDSVTIDGLTVVPEPASLSLLGLAGLGLVARRRRA